MAIIRVRRSGRFTTVSNALLEDERLSWDAMGLMVYLLSKPDNWEVRPRQMLASRVFSGTKRQLSEHKLYRKVFPELRAAGYLSSSRQGDGSVEWVIRESGSAREPHDENQHDEKRHDDYPHDENRHASIKTEKTTKTEKSAKTDAPQAGAAPQQSAGGGRRVRRGTRLPDNWELPDDWAAWVSEERPGMDVVDQAARFRDYWIAQPGQRGVKANWFATWRNWIRRSTDGNGSNQRGGNCRQSAAQAAQQCRDADREWAARKQRERERREQQGHGGAVAH